MPALATQYGINGFTDLASQNLNLSIAALILKKLIGFCIIRLISN